MHQRSSPVIALAAATTLAVMAPGQPLAAQPFVNFGGLEARIGAVNPEAAKTGFGWSVDLDAGYIRYSTLRVLLGLNGFSADVERQVSGTPVGGSLSAIGGRAGVRFDAFGTGRFTPYLLASVTGHNVTADVADAGTQRLLDGFYAGAGLGAGMTFAFDTAGRVAATGEARRIFATNVGHWAFEAGLRWMPRGRGSYVDVERVLVERRAQEEQIRLEAERAREAERQGLAEARRDSAERARRDSVERVRQDSAERAQREAADRARRDSLERARLDSARLVEGARTEAERRQAQQQIEALRARGDSLEAARLAEARARAAAEAQADTARARAAVAEAATLEADRKRYQALVDLHRLMEDVTEIKETERGLAIVLGQGLFASGQYRLSPRARDQVGTISAVLAQYPEHRISVEGHTDATGGDLANQRLSELRAEAVRAALIARGVDPGRIDMVGYGEGTPVADNDTPAGRAQNRRVEIVIVGARRPAEGPGR